MKKTFGLFFCLLGVFLCFLSPSGVHASECENLVDYSPIRTYSDYTASYRITDYKPIGSYSLIENESVCGIKEDESIISNSHTFYISTKRTCTKYGTTTEIECDKNNEICVSSLNSDGLRVAECKSVTSCDTVEGIGTTYYDLLDYPQSVAKKINSYEEGEIVCFDNVIKKCTMSGRGIMEWVETGTKCAANQFCKMKDTSAPFGGVFLDSECKSICTDPVDGLAEDLYCNEPNELLKCYANDSKWHDIDLSELSPGCMSCSNIIDNSTGKIKPSCNDGTKYCDKLISNGIEETGLNKGIDGTTICNKSGTQLYVCNKDNSEDYKSGYYSFYTDCSAATGSDGKPMVCGVGDDGGKARCVNQTEALRNDQSVVRNTVNISVSADTGFMCDVSAGIDSDGDGSSTNDKDGVLTAFGCIPITASGLANKLLPILFGIAGGISFLRMIFGFIMMATSSGDEKKFIEAKSVVSSAIIGLLVSIFAIFLFRLIFVNILQIPGLS